jgi:hypothetical protein
VRKPDDAVLCGGDIGRRETPPIHHKSFFITDLDTEVAMKIRNGTAAVERKVGWRCLFQCNCLNIWLILPGYRITNSGSVKSACQVAIQILYPVISIRAEIEYCGKGLLILIAIRAVAVVGISWD